MSEHYKDQPAYVRQYVVLQTALHENNPHKFSAWIDFLSISLASNRDEDQPMAVLALTLALITLYSEIPGGEERMPLDPQWINTIDSEMAETHPFWYLPGYVEATCAELLKGAEPQKINMNDLAPVIARQAALIDVVLKNLIESLSTEMSVQDAEYLYWEQFHRYMRDAFEHMHKHLAGLTNLNTRWGLPNL